MLFLLLLTAVLREAGGECLRGTIVVSGLSCEQKKNILDRHNKFRDDVAGGKVPGQPKAANMIELRWNDSLAEKAQEWANRCVFGHDEGGRGVGDRFGQNIAMVSSSKERKADLHVITNQWMDEVKSYRYGAPFNSFEGHYTQLVWAKTEFLGCGLVSYKQKPWFRNYLVCNYFPPGNELGKSPYIISEKNCKVLSLFDSMNYDNLCAIDEKKVEPCVD